MENDKKTQDLILNRLRKSKIEVTFYLLNGMPLKGKIKSYDLFTIFIENEKGNQLIYKHAISTMNLPRGFKLQEEENEFTKKNY